VRCSKVVEVEADAAEVAGQVVWAVPRRPGQAVTAYADGVVTEALRRAWEGVKAHLTLKPID
jgi:hypothetical protein